MVIRHIAALSNAEEFCRSQRHFLVELFGLVGSTQAVGTRLLVVAELRLVTPGSVVF